MSLRFLDWIGYFSYLSTFVPLILLVLSYRQQPLNLRWLLAFLCVSFIADLLSEMFYHLKVGNINYVSSTYLLFSIPLISLFFYFTFNYSRYKTIAITINIIYVTFALINLFVIQKAQANSFSATAQALLIISASIVFFYDLLINTPPQNVLDLPTFWIVSGFFFSHAGKVIVYSVLTYLANYVKDNLTLLWFIHNSLSIVGNFIIVIGITISIKTIRRKNLVST